MSQHIEWASGLGDWTVNPGEWVDGYGSRNGAVAIWSGDGDGTIIEFASQEDAAKQLRALADRIEAARETSRYDACRWCGAEIVFVPESMGAAATMWVHVEDLGTETPEDCEAGGFKTIAPTHRFVDDEPTCRDCGAAREDDDDQVCIPQ